MGKIAGESIVASGLVRCCAEVAKHGEPGCESGRNCTVWRRLRALRREEQQIDQSLDIMGFEALRFYCKNSSGKGFKNQVWAAANRLNKLYWSWSRQKARGHGKAWFESRGTRWIQCRNCGVGVSRR